MIGIGKITGGTAGNIVADKCEMQGTCRNLNPEIRDAMPAKMEAIVKGIAEGMGAAYTFNYRRGNASVINDADMYHVVCEAAGEIIGDNNVVLLERPSLGGEDFSCFGELVPSIFYRLGCQRDGREFWPLHSGHFYPNKDALKIGVKIMAASALKYLNKA